MPQVICMHIIKFEMHWNTEFPKGKYVEFGRLNLLYARHWGGCALQTVGNVVLKPLRKRTQEEMSVFTKMLIVVGVGAWWGHQWREEDRIGGRGGIPIWLQEKGSWVKEEKKETDEECYESQSRKQGQERGDQKYQSLQKESRNIKIKKWSLSSTPTDGWMGNPGERRKCFSQWWGIGGSETTPPSQEGCGHSKRKSFREEVRMERTGEWRVFLNERPEDICQ